MSVNYYYLILIGVISYLIGNISPAILIGRLHAIDIRNEGSGNAGTTNVLRVLGAKSAAATLVIDVLKGVVAVRIGLNADDYGAMVAFVCVVIGHIYPALYKFRGGKGVATSLGAALALNWPSAFALILIALFVVGVTKKMSLGSILAAIAYPFLIWYYYPAVLPMAVGMAILIVAKHHANIVRLIKKEEPSINFAAKIKEKLDADPSADKNKLASAVTSDTSVSTDDASESSAATAENSTELENESPSGKMPTSSIDEQNESKSDSSETSVTQKIETDSTEKVDTVLEIIDDEDLDETIFEPMPEPRDYFADVIIPKMKDSERAKVAVIDESPFGLALANRMIYQSNNCIFYISDKEKLQKVSDTNHSDMLPDVLLSSRLRYTANLKTALHNRDVIFINPEKEETWEACARILPRVVSTPIVIVNGRNCSIPSEVRKHKLIYIDDITEEKAIAHNEAVTLTARTTTQKGEKALEKIRTFVKDDGFEIRPLRND